MNYIITNIPTFIIKEDYKSLTNKRTLNDGSIRLGKFLTGGVEIGSNSGNCMFWEATKKIIQEQTSCELINLHMLKENPGIYNGKINALVYVIANSICPVSWPGVRMLMPKNIRDLNCKKYLFSIGAQSKTLDMRNFETIEKDAYKKFFPMFDYVYLRGQYTYDLLKHNKIPVENTKVVGCPSILLKDINTDNLKKKFKQFKRKKNENIKLAINFPGGNQHPSLYRCFTDIMYDKDVYTLAVHGKSWYDTINHNSKIKIKAGNSVQENKSNFKFSYNMFDSMSFFASNADFMFGTRIHGTILGLCAGLPSMCIAIDSRTYELCEQMNIPYINCVNKTLNFQNKNDAIEIIKNNFKISKLSLLEKTLKNNAKLYKIKEQLDP